MTEPFTTDHCPICGRNSLHEHPDSELAEYEASLRRAFVDRRMQSILLDGWNQSDFLWRAANYGHHKGWLTEPQEGGSDREQYTCFTWRITPLGREHFGILP